MRRSTKTYIAVGAVIAAMAILMATGLKNGSTFYLELGEAKAKAASITGKRVRIAGNVATGSISWQPENFALAFALTDGTDTVSVKYKGVRPDNFNDDAPVIAEGMLDSNGVFIADKLLMQCPSKYEAKESAGTTQVNTDKLLEPSEGGTP